MKRFDLSRLMKKAWILYRQGAKKAAITFSEALKKAWQWIKVQAANSEKVQAAAEAAGLGDMILHTWSGWQTEGRMVIHTEQAVLKVVVDDPLTKSGTRVMSYFTREQTQPTPAA